MKTIQTNKDEPYLTFLLNGKKTVEGRLNKGKFKESEIGDAFEINITGDKFEILGKNYYISFEEIEKVLLDKKRIEDGVEVCYKFHTKDQEKNYGVLAFKVKKIKSIYS